MIVTSPPSIIGEFAKSSFAPVLTNATAVVYTPTLATRAGPWVNFSGSNDGSGGVVVSQPPGTIPYWAPGLVLPSDHSSVNVQMFDAHGASSTNLFVNDFLLTLDDNVLVVPVYVHVLRDKNNNVPVEYNGLFQTATNPPRSDADIAWEIRQFFDLSTTRYRDGTIQLESNAVGMHAEKTLANPEAERNFNFGAGDDIFGQCDVQLRLAGVSFIRQGMGLEQAFLSPAETPTVANCGTTAWCDTSRIAVLANQLVTAFNGQPGLARGIHVIVGGQIPPGSGCGQPPAGITCRPTSQRYTLIDGTGRSNGDNMFHMHTVFHEMGHILTGSSDHPPDMNNLMFEFVTGGGLLTPSQCQSIHQRARSL
jgi:hypothetical protein